MSNHVHNLISDSERAEEVCNGCGKVVSQGLDTTTQIIPDSELSLKEATDALFIKSSFLQSRTQSLGSDIPDGYGDRSDFSLARDEKDYPVSKFQKDARSNVKQKIIYEGDPLIPIGLDYLKEAIGTPVARNIYYMTDLNSKISFGYGDRGAEITNNSRKMSAKMGLLSATMAAEIDSMYKKSAKKMKRSYVLNFSGQTVKDSSLSGSIAYAVFRKMRIPIRLQDVFPNAGVSEKEISASYMELRKIVFGEYFLVGTFDSGMCLSKVKRQVESIDESKYSQAGIEKAFLHALKILNSEQASFYKQGKCPITLACSALYAASRKFDVGITAKDMAYKTGVDHVTISKHAGFFSNLINKNAG